MKQNQKTFKIGLRLFCVVLLIIPNNGFSFFNALLMKRPISLEVPIELLDTGIDADTTAHTFENSRTSLDTGDYDGIVTYSFEIVVESFDSVSRTIDLLDSSGTVKASISVPASTALTRRRTTFTPTAGASNYRVKTPAVTLIYDVNIRAARILVTQVNATKTKLYFPLISDYNVSSNVTELQIDGGTGPSWWIDPVVGLRWLKDSTNLATVASGNAWTLEAIIASSAAVGTAKVGLVQAGTTTLVTGSDATTTATVPTLVSASFANSATNFTDNSNFQVSTYHTDAATDSLIYKAGIWVKLVNLSKGSVLYRVGRGESVTAGTTVVYRPESRALINTSVFSRPKVYYEDTAKCSAASCASTSLYDNSTNDSGTTSPTLVTSSTSTPSGTVYARTRSPEITLTSSDRFYAGYTRVSGTYTFVNAFIVVNFSR